jgi:hypothetical protein
MNIKDDFIVDKGTAHTVAESKIQLKGLLDCGEFSLEDYNYQMEELNEHDDSLMCVWGERESWTDKFLDNVGVIYYEAVTGNVVDFVGYC